MILRTNTLVLNAHRNLSNIAWELSRASQRLSSGFRINSAADDAAGLAISEKMRAQIRGLDQSARNAQDAISLIQTAEGGISTINSMIIRMRELVIQAANDTNVHDRQILDHSDRLRIQDEINQLIIEIDEVARRVQFNTRILLDGSYARPAPITPPLFNLMQSYYMRHVASLYQNQNQNQNQNAQIKPNVIQGIQPKTQPTPTTPAININTLADGDGAAGLWGFNDGVLTIYGNGSFQINGSGETNNRIIVNSGVEADIILNNVNINADIGSAISMRGANVNLWLGAGTTNTVASTWEGAGILTTGGTLTINGTGTLNALGGSGSAGIGGGFGEEGGTIVIESGIVNATSGVGGAAIGGGSGSSPGGGGSGGNIYIHGGTVTAINTHEGAAIGGGRFGSGGNITITGGTVIAEGSTEQPVIGVVEGGAGIGGGRGGSGGNINISGGTVTATGGSGAAGIGGGLQGGGGSVTVSGGIVKAFGGVFDVPGWGNQGAAAIGGGIMGAGALFTITGGLVEISSEHWIGGGWWSDSHGVTEVQGGNLSINPESIRNGALHFGQLAFRVQISLANANGTAVPFGPYREVTYTINGLTVNAISDSAGNLFMYLPEIFRGREGEMIFNGRTFSEILEMNPDNDNTLVLTDQDDNGNGGNGGNGENGGNGTRPPGIWGWGQRAANLFDSQKRGRLHFQVGPNSGHSAFLHIEAMDAFSLGLRDGEGNAIINVMLEFGYDLSPLLEILDAALTHATRERSNLGAMQNRLEMSIKSLNIASENLTASESRIRDADMASEITNLSRQANILNQAATAVLAQANQVSDMVLQLLQ